MIKLQTGISTDMDFIKAMKERGQDVSAEFPAETLRDQLNELSEEVDVTFESPNETILEVVNEGEEPGEELTIDFDISDSIDLFGKVASDLQTGVTLDEDDITGTLKYVEGYTGFSSKTKEQSGNYLVLHVDTESEEDVYVQVVNGTKGPVKLDEDRLIVLRIADKDTQGVKVTTGDLVKEYTLDKLTVEAKPEPVPENVTVTIKVGGIEEGDVASGSVGEEVIEQFPAEVTRVKDTVESVVVNCTGYESDRVDVTFDENKEVTITLEKLGEGSGL